MEIDEKENKVIEEIKKARKEKRQAICPYCAKPLEVVFERYDGQKWQWDNNAKKYVKGKLSTGKVLPRCACCDVPSRYLVNISGRRKLKTVFA